jgi:hypothetical protein
LKICGKPTVGFDKKENNYLILEGHLLNDQELQSL